MSGSDEQADAAGAADAEALRRYLDGALPADAAEGLSARMRGDPRLVEALARQVLLEAELARQLRAEGRGRRPRIRAERSGPQRRLVLPLLALTLVAALVAVAVLWTTTPASPAGSGTADSRALARIEAAVGASDAASGAALARGAALPAGSAIRTSAEGSAILISTAGDRISLAGASQVLFAPDADHLFGVQGGSVEVEASHRQPPEVLRVAAGGAEVTVVGTHFRLACSGAGARVSVSAGAVLVRRLADRQEALVRSGEILAVGAQGDLVPGADPLQATRVLRVGPGEGFAHLRDLPELGPGDLVLLPGGVLHEAATLRLHGTADRPVRIIAPDGVLIDGTGIDLSGAAGPRAIIELTGAHALIQGIGCQQAHNPEGNAAGIRVIDGDDIAVRWCSVRACDAGVLINRGGAISLAHTVLDGNGIRGPASAYGNLAAEGCDALDVELCRIQHAHIGDDVSCEARQLRFTSCAIGDGDDESAEIALSAPRGAALSAALSGCLIHLKSRTTGNRYRAIALGPGTALALDHDTVISDLAGMRLVMGEGTGTSLTMDDTVVSGAFPVLAEGVGSCTGGHDWVTGSCLLPAGLQAGRGDARLGADGIPEDGSPLIDQAGPAAGAAAGDARLSPTPFQPLVLPAGMAWPGGSMHGIGAFSGPVPAPRSTP